MMPLRRSNADLQQFVYSASHDLQEPLRMVSIYSELLKKEFGEKLGPDGAEYIGYTVQGALRMEQLLQRSAGIYAGFDLGAGADRRDRCQNCTG